MTDTAQATEPTPAPKVPLPGSPNSKQEPKTKRILLRELGPRLPLGVVAADGSVDKSLACKPWRGREEREVGKLRAASKERGDFITRLLGFMFTKVGPHDFGNMKEVEKSIVLSSMFMGDVFYMYVWLRVQCVDKKLRMKLNCPRCNFSFPFDADLETIEVRTAEKVEQVGWSFKVKTPFNIRGKEAAGFDLAPMRWKTMEDHIRSALESGDTSLSGAKMDIIQGCVRKVTGGQDMMLIEQDYDDMMKVDIENLAARIDEYEIGPDMSLKEKCPRCKRDFVTSLDWGYESFFDSSSPY